MNRQKRTQNTLCGKFYISCFKGNFTIKQWTCIYSSWFINSIMYSNYYNYIDRKVQNSLFWNQRNNAREFILNVLVLVDLFEIATIWMLSKNFASVPFAKNRLIS